MEAMRVPFQKLMELCARAEGEKDVMLGELSKRWNEPVERIMDAITANRVMAGEQTYIAYDVGQPD